MLNIDGLTNVISLSEHQIATIKSQHAETSPGKSSILHLTDADGKPWLCSVAHDKVSLECEHVEVSIF